MKSKARQTLNEENKDSVDKKAKFNNIDETFRTY